MSIFSKLLGKKEASPIVSVLPNEIYQAGVLELKDVIAPSALKVSPKEVNLRESRPDALRHLLSPFPRRKLVRPDHQPRQSLQCLHLHPSHRYRQDPPPFPEESRRSAEPDIQKGGEGPSPRSGTGHRLSGP